jgi:hypothetical protein
MTFDLPNTLMSLNDVSRFFQGNHLRKPHDLS